MLLVLTLAALLIRLRGLHAPGIIFDEAFYMPSVAPALLNRAHGPLGPALLVLSGALFGNSPFGYRVIPMLCGVACVPLTCWLARLRFPVGNTALTAAVLVAFDPMLFLWSRLALLDGFVTILLLASALAWSSRRPALCGVCIGLSLAVKWLAFPLLAALLLLAGLRGQTRPAIRLFGATIFAYCLCFCVLSGVWSPAQFFNIHLAQFRQLKGIVPLAYLHSPFWSWFLVPQCIPLSQSPSPAVTLVETPAILWTGAAALLLGGRRMGVLGLYCVALLLPWVAPWRGTYFYYLVPVLPYVLIALADLLEQRFPGWVRAVFLCNALLSFVVLYPTMVGA
jgi:dolichyl-phosphate-mannose-protein mannosyltransferase